MPAPLDPFSKVRTEEVISSLPSVSASDLKNKFGEVIALASKGGVAITRFQRAEYVLLPVAEYLELQQARTASLNALALEFDVMVARMDTPTAKRALDQLFAATPAALGKSAVKAARKRRAR
jgi:prevent-host-death family protein